VIARDLPVTRACQEPHTVRQASCSGCGCLCHGVRANATRLRELVAAARAERRTRGTCPTDCGHPSHRPVTGW